MLSFLLICTQPCGLHFFCCTALTLCCDLHKEQFHIILAKGPEHCPEEFITFVLFSKGEKVPNAVSKSLPLL